MLSTQTDDYNLPSVWIYSLKVKMIVPAVEWLSSEGKGVLDNLIVKYLCHTI